MVRGAWALRDSGFVLDIRCADVVFLPEGRGRIPRACAPVVVCSMAPILCVGGFWRVGGDKHFMLFVATRWANVLFLPGRGVWMSCARPPVLVRRVEAISALRVSFFVVRDAQATFIWRRFGAGVLLLSGAMVEYSLSLLSFSLSLLSLSSSLLSSLLSIPAFFFILIPLTDTDSPSLADPSHSRHPRPPPALPTCASHRVSSTRRAHRSACTAWRSRARPRAKTWRFGLGPARRRVRLASRYNLCHSGRPADLARRRRRRRPGTRERLGPRGGRGRGRHTHARSKLTSTTTSSVRIEVATVEDPVAPICARFV
ncbi:hypothetical protein DFH09DRAFT_394722 [Mycena vulgaris]|nr:hypothetical protein DFH09DRAFT_394722 [Mycena vulgaris]